MQPGSFKYFAIAVLAMLLGAAIATSAPKVSSSNLTLGQAAGKLAGQPLSLKDGTYSLEGYNAGSYTANYFGTVKIERQGDVYKLQWSIGGQEQRGVGILEDSILSVGYMDVTQGQTRDMGVVSYRLVGEGKLEGKWSSISASHAGKEVLEKVPEHFQKCRVRFKINNTEYAYPA